MWVPKHRSDDQPPYSLVWYSSTSTKHWPLLSSHRRFETPPARSAHGPGVKPGFDVPVALRVFRGLPEDLSSSCSSQHQCSPNLTGKLCHWLGLLRNRSERRTSSQGCSRNPEGTDHDLQPWGSPSEPRQEQMWRQAVGSSQEKPSSRSREENIATWV